MNKPESNAVTPERVTQMAWSFAATVLMHTAVQTKAFDVLDTGPRTIAEVADATGCSVRGVRALLESLLGFGLLARQGDRFSLVPDVAAFLVRGKPGFLGGLFMHINGQILQQWMHLPEIVRTGKPIKAVNQHNQGAEFFAKFVEDLFNLNYAGAAALADALAPELAAQDGGAINVLDIAAGSGVWGIAIAKRMPRAQITALDWKEVTPVTRSVAAKNGVGDRLRTIEGDLNEVDFGRGYHLVTLGHILHSEGEARSRKLLKKVFDALRPGGLVAIAEFVVNDDRSGPVYPLLFAVNMLANTDEGDAYTFGQMGRWLKEIGYTDPRQIAIPAPSPILVARKN